MRTMMSGKIHRATVTEANLDYEGSITLDPDHPPTRRPSLFLRRHRSLHIEVEPS